MTATQRGEAEIDAAAQAIVTEAYGRSAWGSLDETARAKFRTYARVAVAAADAVARIDHGITS